MGKTRFLVVTFPAQGHINPGLQFAARLLRAGAEEVVFATSASADRLMSKTETDVPEGLLFEPYSDGGDVFVMGKGKDKGNIDIGHLMSELDRCGSASLAEIIKAAERAGRPFTRLVYTTLLTWAGRVARDLHLPSTLLWIQPAAVFDIYYHYFNGYGDVIKSKDNDPSSCVELPGLPLLTTSDLPSFLLPSSTHGYVLSALEEHMQLIKEEANQKVLVNTLDALEPESLNAIDGLELIAVGPLIPLPYLDGNDSPPSDGSRGRPDLYQSSKECVEWLDTKAESSVIYVSFGSYSELPKAQMEEIARALLDCRRPFLWIVRALENNNSSNNNDEDDGKNNKAEDEDLISCRAELEKAGMIIPWCSQLEVLSHPSVGCFVTHCGWNSTLESLVLGVPVVAFPLWTDQNTNAKLIEDLWETGVRVRRNEEGVVEREEIGRCLETAMGGGERGEELKRNALKWKEAARVAVREGGSSEMHLRAFVEGFNLG